MSKVAGFRNHRLTRQEGNKTTDHNHNDDNQLYEAEDILNPETPLYRRRVDKKGNCDARKADTSLVPSVDFDTAGMEDVLTKHHAIASAPRKKQRVRCVHGGGQEPGLCVDVFQIVLLPAISRNRGPKLQIHRRARNGNDKAKNPDEKGHSNATRERQDRTRGRKDSRANDAVEDQERGAHDADLSAARWAGVRADAVA